VSSSNHNDANHISGPSRTGEGSFRVLSDILREVDADSLSFINAHGTATAYNDEMESIAIHRAGLDAIPVNGLKGYYGHTLGAAGIIETILSMKAVDNQVVLPTKGFETTGTTYSLNISNQPRRSDKTTFIKILSGFGGSNAGIAWQKGGTK
jgi:3-oxoacyl-[acyl-carrier-protein] synthase-1